MAANLLNLALYFNEAVLPMLFSNLDADECSQVFRWQLLLLLKKEKYFKILIGDRHTKQRNLYFLFMLEKGQVKKTSSFKSKYIFLTIFGGICDLFWFILLYILYYNHIHFHFLDFICLWTIYFLVLFNDVMIIIIPMVNISTELSG